MAGRRAKPASGFRTVVPFFFQGPHGSSIKLLGRSSDAIVEDVRIHKISLLSVTHPDFIHRKSLQLLLLMLWLPGNSVTCSAEPLLTKLCLCQISQAKPRPQNHHSPQAVGMGHRLTVHT